jgi:hypothetical protein
LAYCDVDRPPCHKLALFRDLRINGPLQRIPELSPIFGDGLIDQAAAVAG